jgi:flavin-dependent thymidylate synthase
MKIDLIDYTGAGNPDPLHAARVLVFTKNTRLSMDSARWSAMQVMSQGVLMDELAYMANTIPSSWEFVHYTFAVQGVTRACTHQMVRTRTASFAQQSMRVTDMSGFQYLTPQWMGGNAEEIYCDAMENINTSYKEMRSMGVAEEDARGVLPTNILTNIVCCYNLRAMSDLVKSREGGRTQSEYREAVRLMGDAILRVHPWASLFLYPKGRNYFAELESKIENIAISSDGRRELLKIIDKMRKEE